MPLAEMPQTGKQHAVPQNIMDVEFKLIGDLTMRQFAYLIACGGIAYLSSVAVAGIFKWPLVVIFSLLGMGLAFVPIQERGLDEWIVNFFRAVFSPTLRIWRKEAVIPSAFLYENINVVKQELITLAPTSSRRKLEEYLKYGVQKEKEDPLDIPEQEYIMKVRKAFADVETKPEPAKVSTAVIDSEPPKEKEPEPVKEKPQETAEKPKKPEEAEVEKPEKPTSQKKEEKPQKGIPKPYRKPKPKRTKTELLPIAPITPDMHAGRKFTNLLPSGGELVLPIRGEKVLKTTEEEQEDQRENLEDKTQKLQRLLNQIKSSEEYKKITPISVKTPVPGTKPTTPTKEPVKPAAEVKDETVGKEAEDMVEKLRQENERLEKEIQKIKEEAAKATTPAESDQKEMLLKKLEVQKERASSDYSRLKRQILELQEKLFKKQKTQEESDASAPGAQPKYASIQPLTNKPNVISGIVKDTKGNIVEGLLLIIKNNKGDAVRAFKTNTLGQFTLSTPLINGLYTVEASPSNDKNLTFDIISIEAKGEVIPPLEIIGRALSG